MKLTPEQKQTVATWVAAGDNLSAVQKKLAEQFKISLTYMDVRFLVDDLGLELKNAAPKADASDVGKAAPGAPAASRPAPSAPQPDLPPDAAPDGLGDGEDDLPQDELPESAPEAFPEQPAGAGTLTVDLDRIVRPGAAASGNVTFSDGVSGKWALDQYGRLMLDTGKPGYQPSPADVQAFQRELQAQLQRAGY